MEYSTGKFHVLNAWNWHAEYSRPVWTCIITLGKNIASQNNLALDQNASGINPKQ
jgi:hypothetical protein